MLCWPNASFLVNLGIRRTKCTSITFVINSDCLREESSFLRDKGSVQLYNSPWRYSTILRYQNGRILLVCPSTHIGRIPYRTKFRRTKIFGGQNFRQQVRFSAVLSAEILSDKVICLSTTPLPINQRFLGYWITENFNVSWITTLQKAMDFLHTPTKNFCPYLTSWFSGAAKWARMKRGEKRMKWEEWIL